MNTETDQKRRAYNAAVKCHEELSEILTAVRESFEIWKSLFYFGKAEMIKQWVEIQWFNPFLETTRDAHLHLLIINLVIIGDTDKKGHNIHFLHRKLKGAGCLSFEDTQSWTQILKSTEPLHVKVTTVRNKYLAHRDKNHSWQTLITETGLTPEDLNQLISCYFKLAEDASRILDVLMDSESQVQARITESIMEVRNALSEYRQKMDDPYHLLR